MRLGVVLCRVGRGFACSVVWTYTHKNYAHATYHGHHAGGDGGEHPFHIHVNHFQLKTLGCNGNCAFGFEEGNWFVRTIPCIACIAWHRSGRPAKVSLAEADFARHVVCLSQWTVRSNPF